MQTCPVCGGEAELLDNDGKVGCVKCCLYASQHTWGLSPRVAPNAEALVGGFETALRREPKNCKCSDDNEDCKACQTVEDARAALLRACVVDAAALDALRVQRDEAVAVAADGWDAAYQKGLSDAPLLEASNESRRIEELEKDLEEINAARSRVMADRNETAEAFMEYFERVRKAERERDVAVARLRDGASLLEAARAIERDQREVDVVNHVHARGDRYEGVYLSGEPGCPPGPRYFALCRIGSSKSGGGFFYAPGAPVSTPHLPFKAGRITADTDKDNVTCPECLARLRATGVPEAELTNAEQCARREDSELRALGATPAAPPVADDADADGAVEAFEKAVREHAIAACAHNDHAGYARRMDAARNAVIARMRPTITAEALASKLWECFPDTWRGMHDFPDVLEVVRAALQGGGK